MHESALRIANKPTLAEDTNEAQALRKLYAHQKANGWYVTTLDRVFSNGSTRSRPSEETLKTMKFMGLTWDWMENGKHMVEVKEFGQYVGKVIQQRHDALELQKAQLVTRANEAPRPKTSKAIPFHIPAGIPLRVEAATT